MAHSGSKDDGRVHIGRPVSVPGDRSRFGLTGRSQSYDARTVAIRPDLADIALAGRHFAPHYAAPMMRSVTTSTILRATNATDGEALGELLPGEGFALLDVTGGIAWGYRLSDHLVGYCPATSLGNPIAPSHRVVNSDAQLFSAANRVSSVRTLLPAGALVMGIANGDWLETPHGWIPITDVEEVAAATGR